MTIEEAINMLKSKMDGHTDTSYEWAETVRMAIIALKQKSDIDKYLKQIDHLRRYISKLETQIIMQQEPCDDCVSREFMYKLGAKCIAVRDENDVLVAIASIESLPPVTLQPETGHWIPLGNYDDWGNESSYKCSECGDINTYSDNFYPNCGARMVEQQESEE